MSRVFVYGTLKKDFPSHRRGLVGVRCLGDYRSVDRWPLVIAGERYSPVVFPEKGTGLRIYGEVYEVDEARLALLDRIESMHLADGYTRRLIEVEGPVPGRFDTAFIYMKSRRGVAPIHSGYLEVYRDRRYRPRANR